MVFLPHTKNVILLEPYCGTITEPGLPVLLAAVKSLLLRYADENSQVAKF